MKRSRSQTELINSARLSKEQESPDRSESPDSSSEDNELIKTFFTILFNLPVDKNNKHDTIVPNNIVTRSSTYKKLSIKNFILKDIKRPIKTLKDLIEILDIPERTNNTSFEEIISVNPADPEDLSSSLGQYMEDLENRVNKNTPKEKQKEKQKENQKEKPKEKPKEKQKEKPKENPRKKVTDREHNKHQKEQFMYETMQRSLCSHLKTLDSFVGMDLIKQQITNQILFFILDLYDPGMFLHAVITGNPGTGKTSIAGIIAKIYCSIGFLQNDNVIIAKRDNLIAGYLGQTALKTKKVLDSARGSVLLIDEVYALGSEQGEDSFSKECIDTINQYLSEHVNDMICLIAGYKDSIDNSFFRYNKGLRRRFPWTFHINDYSSSELYEIFMIQLRLEQSDKPGQWSIGPDLKKEYIISKFQESKDRIKDNGGFTGILVDRCKIYYARRIFKKDPDISKVITKIDFDEAFNSVLVKEHKKFNNHELMYT